eukprot:CAMPEP_0180647338 /NCGR_PEP_ID=MMETSP1037_2-20121125/50255_1 /TAXON_ID=632150 /ORGANISM="Azadinium spinosum, Strain 3D9" /LENGTH=179 /DNA_ID=CAMNT_0022671827 /DNA_START=137 /DNA_END=674 /DNA_ORIENTATION=-
MSVVPVDVDIRNPTTHATDATLEALVLAAVPREAYEARQAMARERLEELRVEANTQLPVFFMHPGTRVGSPVLLHFFEPRYKILIRRAWEGNQLFVFCSSVPRRGGRGVVVRIRHAQFLPDGRANIKGDAIHSIVLGNTWVEEGTGGGLFYTQGDLDQSVEGRGVQDPHSSATPASGTQ